MRSDIDRYYELLGVKPGVSVAELKAAHRDLAKVWHPDRFGHDERLQKKAQEKLKEINEAYEIVVTGKVPRPTSNSRTEYQTSSATHRGSDQQTATSFTCPMPERSKVPVSWIVVPLLIFGVVFFAASRYRTRQDVGAESTQQPHQGQGSVRPSTETATSDSAGRQKTLTDVASKSEGTSQAPATETSTSKLQPMQMTTVLIDPATGLLAKADCPVKTRMTYPVGNEPHAFCSASHGSKTSQGDKDSAVKSLAKKVVSPKKWLGSGGQ